MLATAAFCEDELQSMCAVDCPGAALLLQLSSAFFVPSTSRNEISTKVVASNTKAFELDRQGKPCVNAHISYALCT